MNSPFRQPTENEEDLNARIAADAEAPEFEALPDCPSDCYDFERHVMGCPHGPDWDIPNDWEPDWGAETGRERQLREYNEKYYRGEEETEIERARRLPPV